MPERSYTNVYNLSTSRFSATLMSMPRGKLNASLVRQPSEPLREIAYRKLQARLHGGEVAGGTPLSEVALAAEFGMSRTPVREAIGQLVAEGLLEQVPNRGTVLRQLTHRDVVELYEMREAIEIYAIGKVTKRGLSDAEAAELRKLIARIDGLRTELVKSKAKRLSEEQMREFVQLDLSFHTILLQACGNSRLLKAVYDTRLLIRIFALPHEGHDVLQLDQIQPSHKRILKAVLDGDVGEAQAALSEHIDVSRRERLRSHDAWERQESFARVLAQRGVP